MTIFKDFLLVLMAGKMQEKRSHININIKTFFKIFSKAFSKIIVVKLMKNRVRTMIFWLLFLGTLGTVIFLGLVIFHPPVAMAAIQQLEETPGQMVYQSRQNLKDQQGNTWQAIAFKRTSPDHKNRFYLRLVGFPGVTKIDRTQPIALTNSLGKSFTASDASQDIFAESNAPQSNVGQYDIESLLLQLSVEIPWELTLPTISGEAVNLAISPTLIQEWQTLAQHS